MNDDAIDAMPEECFGGVNFRPISFPAAPVRDFWYRLGEETLLIKFVAETHKPSRSNPGECVTGGTDGWYVEFRYSPIGEQYRRFISREEG